VANREKNLNEGDRDVLREECEAGWLNGSWSCPIDLPLFCLLSRMSLTVCLKILSRVQALSLGLRTVGRCPSLTFAPALLGRKEKSYC